MGKERTKSNNQMIYELYKKQVEAWKERFGKDQDGPVIFSGDYQQLQQSGFFRHPDYEAMLSSRHKDTIELIEAIIKEVDGMKWRKFANNVDAEIMKGGYSLARHDILTTLQAQKELIEKEK